MIKVMEIRNTDADNRTVKVSLFSDTKDEVATTSLDDVIGFPSGMSVEFGSDLITADGDVAFMKSDGTWNWVE